MLVVLKAIRKCPRLTDAWISARRWQDVVEKVFFRVIFAISSGPGAFLRDILLMAHLSWFIVMMGLLATGSGYIALSMSDLFAGGGTEKNVLVNSTVFPWFDDAPLIVGM